MVKTCRNCQTQVSDDYVRVMCPDDASAPEACPYCEDLIRDGQNKIQEATASRANARTL